MQLLGIMQPVTEDEVVALVTAMRTGLIHRGSSSAEPSGAEGVQKFYLYK